MTKGKQLSQPQAFQAGWYLCLSVYPTLHSIKCVREGQEHELQIWKHWKMDQMIIALCFTVSQKQGSSSGQWTHHSRLLIISSGCGATADLLPILGAGEWNRQNRKQSIALYPSAHELSRDLERVSGGQECQLCHQSCTTMVHGQIMPNWIQDVATIVRFTFTRCSIVKGDLLNIENTFYVIFKADEMNDFDTWSQRNRYGELLNEILLSIEIDTG